MLAVLQTLGESGLHQAQVIRLPAGRAGIARTLRLIVAEAGRSMYAPQVRQLALRIVADVPERDTRGEAEAVQAWVRERIRYVRDPRGREVVQSAALTLYLRQGDCDDHTVLILALLGALGHITRATAIGLRPGRFQHVFPETLIGGQWLSVEATEEWPLGYTPPGIVERMSLAVSAGGDAVGELAGFGLKKLFKKIKKIVKPALPAIAGISVGLIPGGLAFAPLAAGLVGSGQQMHEADKAAAKAKDAARDADRQLDEAATAAAVYGQHPELKDAIKARLVAAGANAQAELDRIVSEFTRERAMRTSSTAGIASDGEARSPAASFFEQNQTPILIGGAVLGTALALRLMRPTVVRVPA